MHTRKRIQELATAYNYTTVFRGLRSATRSGILGFIVSSVNALYFARTLTGILPTVFAAGHQVIPPTGNWDIRQTVHGIQQLVARGVDGLLLYLDQISEPIPAEVIIDLTTHGLPVVCISNAAVEHPLDRVTKNEDLCGQTVIDHLFSYAHRQVAYLGPAQQHPRSCAVIKAAEHRGMKVQVIPADRTDACPALLSTRFHKQPLTTAFIGFDDVYAAELLRFAIQRTVRVPRDISVVWCCHYRFPLEPMLTSVEGIRKNSVGVRLIFFYSICRPLLRLCRRL